jgi:hypothetical protein
LSLRRREPRVRGANACCAGTVVAVLPFVRDGFYNVLYLSAPIDSKNGTPRCLVPITIESGPTSGSTRVSES